MTKPRVFRSGLNLGHESPVARRCFQIPYAAKERMWARAGYHPFPHQEAFHRSTARFKVLVGGARFGKSLSAAMDVLPEVLTPGTVVWIVGPTYDLALKEFRFIFEALQRLGHHADIGYEVEKSIIESVSFPTVGRAVLRTRWGSRVETRTAANPDSLLGEEVDVIIVAEASRIAKDIIQRYLIPRLATRAGRLIVPTTPFGVNWVADWHHRGVAAKPVDPRSPAWMQSFASFIAPTYANPLIPWEEILLARDTLDADVFAEQYLAQFVRQSGLVYRLQPEVHVFDEMPAGSEVWPTWRAIDFGYVNPFVCLWGAKDHDGRWWIFDEHYKSHELLADHAGVIKSRHRGRKLQGTAADHDAQDRAELDSYGIRSTPAVKDIRTGIWSVKNALVVQRDQKPRLYIARRCVNTIREFGMYSWPPEDETDTKSPKEEPLDAHNHAMDCVRYLLATFDKPEAVGVGATTESAEMTGWAFDNDRGGFDSWM